MRNKPRRYASSFWWKALGLLLAVCPLNEAFAQKISLKCQQVPLYKAIELVAHQADMSVVYNTEDIDSAQKVSIQCENAEVQQALNLLLQGTGIGYKIAENHLVFFDVKESQQKQQMVTVRGTVTDDSKEPLIGVSIQNLRTKQGGITDFDGHFSIRVAIGDKIKTSYIGYASQIIEVKHQRTIDIVMAEDTKLLDEVVVTALGIKREEKALSYNVQQVDASEITTVKDANFMNSLAGKIPGVSINASSAGAGGATRVVMRGTKSISSNNNALYVIDGVPIFNANNGTVSGGEYSIQPGGEGISDINPEDIASMSVLSGPAAAALYGSNAAQGVILITTKKGVAGKTHVTITSNASFSSPFVMPEFQNTYANKPQSFRSWGNKLDASSGYKPSSFFNTGSNIQNTISLTTGNEHNQTYVSIGSTNAKGLILNNDYNRYNFTFRNTTSFLDNKMKLDLSLNVIRQDNQNMMAQGQYFNPLLPVYLYPRGENFDDARLFERYDEGRNINVQHWPWGSVGMNMQNPYWLAKRNEYGTKRNRYMANVTLQYDINSWMNIVSRARLDNSTVDNETKRYASTAELFADPKGFYSFSKGNDNQYYGDVMLNIDKRIDDFSLNVNAGGSATYLYSDYAGYQGGLKDLPNVFNFYNINVKSGRDAYPKQEGYEETTISTFASAELGWKSMLYLTVTGRSDWASALANTAQSSFFYPSIGLSGMVNEMVKLPSWIPYFKVRGSYASVGSAIPRGMSQPRYRWDEATGKWSTNSDRPLGELKPERTDSWEAGFSTKMFENHVTLDVTWYRSNTKNQTFTAPTSLSSGYSSIKVQSGDVQNTGWEVSLGLNHKLGPVDWDSNVTFSTNKNEIKELVDDYYDVLSGKSFSLTESPQGGLGSVQYILTKGGTMGDIYSKTGFRRDSEGNIWVGQDTQNVQVVQLENPEKLGSVLPKANIGFRNHFNYKGIDLGFMVSARLGGIVVSPTQAILDEFGVSKATAIARDNGGVWVNNGYISAENYYTAVGGKNGVMSEYTYDATNVRLQELSLGYSLPKKWFNDFCSLKVSVVGRNLWMIYNKAPFDPQSTASSGTYYQGLDFFMQPSLRNIGFNVKLQF